MKTLKQTILTWLSITKEKFPTIFWETTGTMIYLLSMLLTPCVLVLVCLASILRHLLTLLLTIGCSPLLITSWVLSNLKYSGAKMHQDSLQKWGSRLLKISDQLEESLDILSAYIKRSLSSMDSDK